MVDEDKIVRWPAWRYGPDGQSEIFASEDEVPEGWENHPSKVGKPSSKVKTPDPKLTGDSPYKDKSDAEVIAELKLRKLEFGAKWPRTKLEGLLIADDAKKAK